MEFLWFENLIRSGLFVNLWLKLDILYLYRENSSIVICIRQNIFHTWHSTLSYFFSCRYVSLLFHFWLHIYPWLLRIRLICIVCECDFVGATLFVFSFAIDVLSAILLFHKKKRLEIYQYVGFKGRLWYSLIVYSAGRCRPG